MIMIKTRFFFPGIIEFTNTNVNDAYEVYVNEKYYKKLDIIAYKLFYLEDEILNAKSIILKKITFIEYLSKNTGQI